MPQVKVVTGAPCSGKTRYVREHIGANDVCYDFDRLMEAVSFRVPHDLDTDHLQGLVLDIRDSLLSRIEKGRTDGIDTVWMIAMAPNAELKGRLDSLHAEYIPMDTPLEECLLRLEADDSRRDKDAWRQIIEQWFSAAEEPVSPNIEQNQNTSNEEECNMEFTPITTQEEFDARVAQLYGDVSGLQTQLDAITQERDGHADTIVNLQKQVKEFQNKETKRRIAAEKGIPVDFVERLTGETEAELYADADALAGMLRAVQGPAPLAVDDNNAADEKSVMRSFVQALTDND